MSRLMDVAREAADRVRSWSPAKQDYARRVIKAGMMAQVANQREFVEGHTPKGPLWFWEEIPNPYTSFWI